MRRSSTIHRRDRRPDEIATARSSIRIKCLECCCWQAHEVNRCHIEGCWLWPYRMGRTVPPERTLIAEESADSAQKCGIG